MGWGQVSGKRPPTTQEEGVEVLKRDMEGYSLTGWGAGFQPPDISLRVQSCLLGGSVMFPHRVFLSAFSSPSLTFRCAQPPCLAKLLGLSYRPFN